MTTPADGSGRDDIPADLRREFWTLVVIFNIAILGIGAGGMLLVFGRNPTLAWTGVIIGVAFGAYGYGRYRRRTPDAEQRHA